MRKIREVLRLRFDLKLSDSKVAQSCHMGRSTVGDYIQRFNQSALCWPLPESVDDSQLEQLLFDNPQAGCSDRPPAVDWAYIHVLVHNAYKLLMVSAIEPFHDHRNRATR